MKEKDIQRLFSKKNTRKGVFELKLTKGKSIRFDALADHQERALIGASSSVGCSHKISDFSLEQKPFDCFRIVDYPAYVVVCFYVPRVKKRIYYVEVGEWVALRSRVAPRKSVKEVEVEDVAVEVVDI